MRLSERQQQVMSVVASGARIVATLQAYATTPSYRAVADDDESRSLGVVMLGANRYGGGYVPDAVVHRVVRSLVRRGLLSVHAHCDECSRSVTR